MSIFLSETLSEREVRPRLALLVEGKVDANRAQLGDSEGDADAIAQLELWPRALVEILDHAVPVPCSPIVGKSDEVQRTLDGVAVFQSREERLFPPEPLVWVAAQ